MSKKSRLAALKARRKKLDRKKNATKPIAISPQGVPHTLEPGVKVAEYQCQSCALEFVGAPAPCICPECKHLYVMWTNYNKGDG